ncbi:hypothetical protein NDU88_000986 [Pleurodeles waltl]|uniref:Uncharacterized protein n=1 Tax=Pleurodeles waltl TaxID=8319 RepID=A0AAV7VW97_PLEWA|nr:hypothetical protein NDU88_000986 [Pleurodeles waltl]
MRVVAWSQATDDKWMAWAITSKLIYRSSTCQGHPLSLAPIAEHPDGKLCMGPLKSRRQPVEALEVVGDQPPLVTHWWTRWSLADEVNEQRITPPGSLCSLLGTLASWALTPCQRHAATSGRRAPSAGSAVFILRFHHRFQWRRKTHFRNL